MKVSWAVRNRIPTGQDKVTSYVAGHLRTPVFGGDTGIFRNFIEIIRFVFFICVKKPGVLYLVPSRSKFGLIRDSLIACICRIFRWKTVCHIHGNDLFLIFDSGFARALGRAMFSFGLHRSHFLLLSDAQVKELEKLVRDFEFSVVPNPLSFSVPDVTDPKCSRLVYASFLHKEKGILDFLALAARVDNLFHKVEVWGGCSDEEIQIGLKKFSQECENFEYMGEYSESDLDRVFDTKTMFYFPSSYKTEAQPLIIGEALSRGSVVFSNDVGFVKSAYSRFSRFNITQSLEDITAQRICSAFEKPIDIGKPEIEREIEAFYRRIDLVLQ